jgi:hypothetical protein
MGFRLWSKGGTIPQLKFSGKKLGKLERPLKQKKKIPGKFLGYL